MRALLIAAVLAVGCARPDGIEVDARAAARLVLDTWGHVHMPTPRVFLVDDDGCAGPDHTGFLSPSGHCAGGTTFAPSPFEPDPAIYLVRTPDLQLSWHGNFPHELAHWVGHEHAGEDWAADSAVGRMVAAGTRALEARPDLDFLKDPRP